MPEHKIRERFSRSAPLVRAAAHIADTTLVHNASALNAPPRTLARLSRGRADWVVSDPPDWFLTLYGPQT